MAQQMRASIVDYGMGNIRSLARALERAGLTPHIVSTPKEIAQAERLVIPGQGAFGQAVAHLDSATLRDPLIEFVGTERPFLGVCLGHQILFEASSEAPGKPGLGLVDSQVGPLPAGEGLKIPHMGWSAVTRGSKHPVLSTVQDAEAFYFVHSYAAFEAPGWDALWASHGTRFVAAMARDNLVSAQFHPEKSQAAGHDFLEAWGRL